MTRNILKLVISIALCQLVGLVGAIFTLNSLQNWYLFLNKPSFNPPNWLFGPVWTALYILMGVSFYWIWSKGMKEKGVRAALGLFVFHLGLNVSWSIVFFGWHDLFLSLVNIAALWVLIVWVIIKFYRIEKKAGLILLPYLTWVSFASFLNYYIFLLNK